MNPNAPKRPGSRSIDGFRRSRTPQTPVARPTLQSTPKLPVTPLREPTEQPPRADVSNTAAISDEKPVASIKKLSRSRRKLWGIVILIVVALIVICGAVLYGWYRHELTAVNSSDTSKQDFVVKAGSTPHQIADGLEQKHLIRSSTAFYVYLVLTHQRDNLQAGTYQIAPAKSVSDIVHKMTHGAVSNFSVTFFPGGTIAGTQRLEPKYSVTTQLKNAGYNAGEIHDALAATYDEAGLFAGKPTGSSLEGYIYGDTYSFSAGTPAESVVARSLSEFSSIVKQNNLAALYKKQHLSLYQGITLASIVQREIDKGDASKGPSQDQRQVAQVFLLRLKKHMTLGSDVTYIYAAEQLGVAPTPEVDSPYNTRKYAGLPPGPIATPGLNALLAVAHPASTDYLFFLSGDDGKTYFSKTDSGHQQNIANHCQKKCQY